MVDGVNVFLAGFIILALGLMMPAEVTQTKEVCTEPTGENACEFGSRDDVEVTKENKFRPPVIVVGLAAMAGGLFIDPPKI